MAARTIKVASVGISHDKITPAIFIAISANIKMAKMIRSPLRIFINHTSEEYIILISI
jgi:hypothetical protein